MGFDYASYGYGFMLFMIALAAVAVLFLWQFIGGIVIFVLNIPFVLLGKTRRSGSNFKNSVMSKFGSRGGGWFR